MPDITKCLNAECSMREQCYRWTAPSSNYQSVAFFKPTTDNECENFMEKKDG